MYNNIYIHLHVTFMYSILLGGEVAQPPIRMFHNVSFLEISGLPFLFVAAHGS